MRNMENIKEPAGLIGYYGEACYGSESPEYIVQQWDDTFPGIELSKLQKCIDEGFWRPEAARERSLTLLEGTDRV